MSKLAAPDIANLRVIIIYKRSRYEYAQAQLSADIDDPLRKALKQAHDKNLLCIDLVEKFIKNLGLAYSIKCRSDLKTGDLDNCLVLSVGGDGTLLDASHYCQNSPILGINSDPLSSIGALCAADVDNFAQVLQDIYQNKLNPCPIKRLEISSSLNNKKLIALNDVLFCHKNPACMARFSLTLNNHSETHHNSGIWIASPLGSTGAIYSAGGKDVPIDHSVAQFVMRESYWCDQKTPRFLRGELAQGESLLIKSNMTEGSAFIDGPHKSIELELGGSLHISLAPGVLWLFEKALLNNKRKKILNFRKSINSNLNSRR